MTTPSEPGAGERTQAHMRAHEALLRVCKIMAKLDPEAVAIAHAALHALTRPDPPGGDEWSHEYWLLDQAVVGFEMAPRPQCQIDDLKRIRDLFMDGRTLAHYGRSALAGQVLDSTSHPSEGDAR